MDENNPLYLLTKLDYCTGCGCCRNICSVNAIEMEYDDSGYLRPRIDTEKCVHCMKCVNACPKLNDWGWNDKNDLTPHCYAFQAKNEIREKSSSGGFFSAIASYVFKRGGYVYGAVWDEGFYCKIVEGENFDSIEPMRCSKYVQSSTDDTFIQVKNRLLLGKIVAYFGCPCQILGLKSYIKNSNIPSELTENLITVDLLCFYAPSNELFRKYLDEEYGLENIHSVNFRYKPAVEDNNH